jgi:hypothetical protein
MRFHWLIGAAALVLLMQISPSAGATLMGATVQSASYLNVSSPPPPASPTECTIIDCMILDYEGPSGPTNSPLPTVPVTYLEDSLTETTVSVGDTQITITNNLAGFFCPGGVATGCTPGDFSGYVFTFMGAPNITGVVVGSGTSSDFQPVSLTSTTDSITVDVAGDNLAVNDQLHSRRDHRHRPGTSSGDRPWAPGHARGRRRIVWWQASRRSEEASFARRMIRRRAG